MEGVLHATVYYKWMPKDSFVEPVPATWILFVCFVSIWFGLSNTSYLAQHINKQHFAQIHVSFLYFYVDPEIKHSHQSWMASAFTCWVIW